METKNNTNERFSKCEELKHDIQNYGTPLTKDIAAGYIQHYLDGVQAKPKDDHNFGYLFGFDNITTFVNDIIAYNNDAANPTKVQGVRVYIGRHIAIDPNVPAIPREKIMDNVFLIPVLSTGVDLPVVHHLEDNTIILGEPRPCPNECLMSVSFLKDLKK